MAVLATAAGVYCTRDGSRQDQRAWVHVDKHSLWSNGPVVVGLALSNTGKTPAFNVVSRMMVSVAPTPISPMPASAEAAKPIVLHPAQPFTMLSADLSLNAEQAAAFNSGQTRIYVRTLICYDDASGVRHWVTTCASHTVRQPIENFDYCETGNAAGTDGFWHRTCWD